MQAAIVITVFAVMLVIKAIYDIKKAKELDIAVMSKRLSVNRALKGKLRLLKFICSTLESIGKEVPEGIKEMDLGVMTSVTEQLDAFNDLKSLEEEVLWYAKKAKADNCLELKTELAQVESTNDRIVECCKAYNSALNDYYELVNFPIKKKLFKALLFKQHEYFKVTKIMK